MSAIKLTVTGMHCSHCRAKVASALQHVDGVYGVEVDVAGGTAAVDAAPTTAAEQLVAAVRQAGYDAQVAA